MLEKNVGPAPDDPHFQNVSAVALARLERTSLALEHLRKAHHLEPANLLYTENLTHLEKGVQGCELKP